MKLYAGLEVQVTADESALRPYGSERAAGCRGTVMSSEPVGWVDGFAFFEVMVFMTAYGIREDHLVPWTGRDVVEENEDMRWRRAAQDNWKRIYDGKPER